jgi:antitoxin (DNA-binding transcriptional repressor) of toxin-antitoxin stability system
VIIVDATAVASDLGAYLSKVEHGETVVIAVRNRQVAELRATNALPLTPRPFGLSVGEFVVPPDFDAPLPEDLLADFESR